MIYILVISAFVNGLFSGVILTYFLSKKAQEKFVSGVMNTIDDIRFKDAIKDPSFFPKPAKGPKRLDG